MRSWGIHLALIAAFTCFFSYLFALSMNLQRRDCEQRLSLLVQELKTLAVESPGWIKPGYTQASA